VAQISEFSLILAALGLSLGHIGTSAMSLITLVGLVTIFASTYMILYSGPLYARLSSTLGIFERSNPHREAQAGVDMTPSGRHLIVLMGLGNYGSAIASRLKQHGWLLLAVDFDPQALTRGREMELPVLYGDVGDPEMLVQLPLDKTQWVLCAIRDRDVNVSLFNLLRETGFNGRIALTAGDAAQAEEYHRIGAQLVLQPFIDSAEQAVEAVTGAIQSLPGLRDWPAVLEEVALQPGSVFTGKTLRELDLRREIGVSVLAVSRAGNVHFNPAPDFRMYPGDRIVLLCSPDQVGQAVNYLRQRELGTPQDQAAAFGADELSVSTTSEWVGKSLADMDFRNRHGVTVIGIRRGNIKITSPSATDTLQPGDGIVVVGSLDGVKALRDSQKGPEESELGLKNDAE